MTTFTEPVTPWEEQAERDMIAQFATAERFPINHRPRTRLWITTVVLVILSLYGAAVYFWGRP